MVTQATAFAQTTKYSSNPVELQKRILALYRQFMRHSPTIAETYELSYPVAKVRTKIRQEFERNRFVQDVGVLNVLHAKGQMEFQETINFWKQQPHVYKFFADEERTVEKKQSNDFIDKFLHGTA